MKILDNKCVDQETVESHEAEYARHRRASSRRADEEAIANHYSSVVNMAISLRKMIELRREMEMVAVFSDKTERLITTALDANIVYLVAEIKRHHKKDLGTEI